MNLDPVTAISDLVKTSIDKIFPDANQKAQALAEFAKLRETDDFQVLIANLQINLADAQSKNWFQSSWRPALAWSCVTSFVYHFLLYPAASTYIVIKDIAPGDFAIMMGVLTVLIGARTYDKSKGTDTP